MSPMWTQDEAAVYRLAALSLWNELETRYRLFERTPDMVFGLRHNKLGYSKKFLEEHREEITLHKAAKTAFNQLDSAGGPGKVKSKISTIRQLIRNMPKC